MKQAKKYYLEYWNDLTKTQNKLDCYLALKITNWLNISSLSEIQSRGCTGSVTIHLQLKKENTGTHGYQKNNVYVVTARQEKWKQRCTFSYIVKNTRK